MNLVASILAAWVLPLQLEYLSWPLAMGIFALLASPIILLGMRSLNGLGPVRKWVAIGVRLAVLLLFVLIIGGARWQRINRHVEVIVLRDVSESMSQVKDYPKKTLLESQDDWIRNLSDDKNSTATRKEAEDRLGVVGFSNNATIEAMPSILPPIHVRAVRDGDNAT